MLELYLYVHVHAWDVCRRARTCVCKCLCLRACVRVCTRVCIRLFACVCLSSRARVCACAFVCVSVHVAVFTCVCVCARPCVFEQVVEGAGVADGRPSWLPSFFPALPEPFTYRATASEAEARGEAATVKRHHTQLVREVGGWLVLPAPLACLAPPSQCNAFMRRMFVPAVELGCGVLRTLVLSLLGCQARDAFAHITSIHPNP